MSGFGPPPGPALEGNSPLLDLIHLVEELIAQDPAAAAQLYRDWSALHLSSPGLYIAQFNLGVLLANQKQDRHAEQAYVLHCPYASLWQARKNPAHSWSYSSNSTC